MTDAKEVVLPSGRFACIRPILWGDFVAALAGPSNMLITGLIVRCVTIDGVAITFEQLMAMDIEEIIPINHILQERIKHAMATEQGIA